MTTFWPLSGKDPISLKEAIFHTLSASGDLYFPKSITPLSSGFFANLASLSAVQIGEHVLEQFFVGKDGLTRYELREVLKTALSFRLPVKRIAPRLYALELFHGPTLAFKDIGARVLSGLIKVFRRQDLTPRLVIVATSGDTGGAVASSFRDTETPVVIFFPKSGVSAFQRRQLTTGGRNVLAIEVDGTFDDCQWIVKKFLGSEELTNKFGLVAANSVSLGRLLPQIIYYVTAFRELLKFERELAFGGKRLLVSVPSGNFGNLTAGVMAKRLGIPIHKFVAATNRNDVVPRYLSTGEYQVFPTVSTIANAMDVGNPSNFPRLKRLYDDSHEAMVEDIGGFSLTDDEIKDTIFATYRDRNYLLDPHGAIAYHALLKDVANSDDTVGLFLHTAAPVKFSEIVFPIVQVPVSNSVKEFMTQKESYEVLSASRDPQSRRQELAVSAEEKILKWRW
jgi:threonine synthase